MFAVGLPDEQGAQEEGESGRLFADDVQHAAELERRLAVQDAAGDDKRKP